MEDDLKTLSISGKKSSVRPCSSFFIPALSQRAWLSGKPVPQFEKLLVVSYRKERNPPTVSTDTTYCSVKGFSLPKKKHTKKRLKPEFDILLSDAVFSLVSGDGLLVSSR